MYLKRFLTRESFKSSLWLILVMALPYFLHILRLALSAVSSVEAFVRKIKLFTLKQVLCWFFLYVSEKAKHVRGVWLVVICPKLH